MPPAVHLNNNDDYIDTTDYKKLGNKLMNLKSVLDDLVSRQMASRKLRYSEVDIEAEREAGRIQPDEIYAPTHLIDTNIRREQSSYIQYITQSPRAIIAEDLDDNSVDLSLLEKDLTKKLRFDGWQLGMYANVDAFQANGYSVVEVVYDDTLPGHTGHEMVQYGDFAFIQDTRDLQAVEMTARTYYYTKTQLLKLADPIGKKPEDVWSKEQVDKVCGTDTAVGTANPDYSDTLTNSQDRSLYRIHKVMYRIKGIVNVGWTCIGVCDDWMRQPRPLYVGRRQPVPENPLVSRIKQMRGLPPKSTEQYETQYPYFSVSISHLREQYNIPSQGTCIS